MVHDIKSIGLTVRKIVYETDGFFFIFFLKTDQSIFVAFIISLSKDGISWNEITIPYF